MNWYVYLLECRDDSLYCGITNNVKQRMDTHKKGKGSKYVKRKGYKQLLHVVKVADKSTALKEEYKIKKMRRNDKITYVMQHNGLQF